MKTSKALLFFALLLAVLFLSQFVAEIYFQAAPKPESNKKMGKTGFDLKVLSLDSRRHTEAAFAWLEAGNGEAGDGAIKTSMALLRRALRLNPLDYQAHYYLARAYLQFSAVDNDYFELAVRELKRAASIRGTNKQIALDCARVFFSIWPLLSSGDRSFTLGLLANVMPSISWVEFSPLLEMWSFYVQDANLLMELLKRKPEFFGSVADQLVAAAIPIEQRRKLLVLHEIHSLDAMERRFNELSLLGAIRFADARSLLNQMLRMKGYYRLHSDNSFVPEKMARLQRDVMLEVIANLLTDAKAQADPNSAPQLKSYIQTYIAEHSGLNDLDELQKLLEENDYFKENDFYSLYLKSLIAYKKGSYGDVIAEIEALRKTISFVKKEQLSDYTNILLLLVDSYYSSKLLTAAEAVAQELYQSQPDNPDILFRVLRVQKILGDEGVPDKMLNDKLATVENSRFLTVVKANSRFDVYLFNQPEIEIVFESAWLATLKPKQLLQVFVDGKIAFENYVDAVPEKIVIGKPFTDIERKVKVQVNVL